jgi:hypothetical protein
MVLKILLLLSLLTAGQAFATSTLTVVGPDNATGLSNLWIDENGTPTQAGWVGGLDVSGTGIVPLVYCVQLSVGITNGTYNTVLDFSDPAADQRVAWLMEYEWPSSFYSGSQLQIQGAAFQLAIWDILVDGGDGFGTATTKAGNVSQSTGSTATPAAVITAATQYESLSFGKTATSFGVVYDNTVIGTGAAAQNLMGATPEPAAMVLICSGLAMIAVGCVRRRNPR